MPNTIPISLQWNPVTNQFTYTDLNSLGVAICQQIQSAVAANVSLFLIGVTPPATDQGLIFFSTATNAFYSWSTVTGSYQPVGILFIASVPVTNMGTLIWVTGTNTLYFWSGSSYQPVTTQVVGDLLLDYTNGDELSRGYVQALGSRTIDSITALSVTQNAALHTLFGAGALIQIPNVSAPVSTVAGGGGGGATLYPKIYCGF